MKKKASIIAIILAVTINYASCVMQSCPVSQEMDTGYELNDLYNYFGKIPFQEEMFYTTSQTKKNYGDAKEQFPKGTDYTGDNDRIHCTSYPVREGGLFFVFWSCSLSPEFNLNPIGKEYAVYSFYYSTPHKLQDFDSISKCSTAEDVSLIDPGMEMSFIEITGPYSYHILEDDQILRIKYQHPDFSKIHSREDIVVLSMDVLSPEATSNPFCKCQFVLEVLNNQANQIETGDG